MSVVIEFQELVRQRRRRQTRATELRCVEILRESLAFYEAQLESCTDAERLVYQRRVRQLADLLAYVAPRI